MRYGLIAGNGRFPVLALEAARKAGLEVVAIGIKEEASKEIEPLAARSYWISLGAVVKVLADEGIMLADSTLLLKDLLAPEGVLTRRKPSAEEDRDIAYGRR